MRKLTLNNKTASIEINGEVYDILLSDSDITELAEVVKEKCKNLTAGNSKGVVSAAKTLADSIEKMLGAGSVAKIAGGKPVGVCTLLDWFWQIVHTAYAAHFDRLVEEND